MPATEQIFSAFVIPLYFSNVPYQKKVTALPSGRNPIPAQQQALDVIGNKATFYHTNETIIPVHSFSVF